jgi:hypothetical protein
MSITVDLITARKNRQIIVPEKHDAATYFNGLVLGCSSLYKIPLRAQYIMITSLGLE